MSFAEDIHLRFTRSAGRRALDAGGRTSSFSELGDSVQRFVAGLAAFAVPARSRIALLTKPGIDAVVAHFAVLVGGHVAVPLDPNGVAEEWCRQIRTTRSVMVVADLSTLASELDIPVHSTSEIMSASVPSLRARHVEAAVDDSDPAAVIFTSGTTGPGKAAVLRHENFSVNAAVLKDAWRLVEEDHLLLALPLFHVHGLAVGLHGMIAAGHRVTLLERFDAESVLDRLADPGVGVTLFYGVPTMYERLLRAAPSDYRPSPSLRLCVCGSAPLSIELAERFRDRLGITLLERYGMTETLITVSQSLDEPRRVGTIGRPLPGVELDLVANDGRLVDIGEEGEIRIRSRQVFAGYLDDPEATAASFDEDGRFRSGDLAVRDADGILRITGRAKDLVITGGHNVHPREVEECLLGHPGVVEVAVFGVADPEWGERLTAACVVRSTATSADELRAWCAERLAPYKKPRTIVFIDALPRNALGKVKKSELKRRFSEP